MSKPSPEYIRVGHPYHRVTSATGLGNPTPYYGLTVYSRTGEWPWRGKNSLYRFHVEDPITFEKSISVTIEHGHANHLSNDYSSTAYWYQAEPHRPFPPLLPVEERLPRPEPG